MRIRDWVVVQLGIVFVYLLTTYIQFHHLGMFNTTTFASVFFLPAAVRVFSVILFGYWAGIGIAIGTVIHVLHFNNVGFTPVEIAAVAIEQGLMVAASLFVWALVSPKVRGLREPEIDFRSITAFDILALCLIQAVINSVAGHLFLSWAPTVQQGFDPYQFAVMLVGDITGAFFVFIFSNLVFSGLLRLGIVSRARYDQIMNERTAL